VKDPGIPTHKERVANFIARTAADRKVRRIKALKQRRQQSRQAPERIRTSGVAAVREAGVGSSVAHAASEAARRDQPRASVALPSRSQERRPRSSSLGGGGSAKEIDFGETESERQRKNRELLEWSRLQGGRRSNPEEEIL
jgi:hypothetical protein